MQHYSGLGLKVSVLSISLLTVSSQAASELLFFIIDCFLVQAAFLFLRTIVVWHAYIQVCAATSVRMWLWCRVFGAGALLVETFWNLLNVSSVLQALPSGVSKCVPLTPSAPGKLQGLHGWADCRFLQCLGGARGG